MRIRDRSESLGCTVARLEVAAGLRADPDRGPIDLERAWMEADKRRDPKLQPIMGNTGWCQYGPMHNPSQPQQGCEPGSEEQTPETCSSCRGEAREGFVCLSCLPGGREQAAERNKRLRAAHRREERSRSQRRNGKRFSARDVLLSGSRAAED